MIASLMEAPHMVKASVYLGNGEAWKKVETAPFFILKYCKILCILYRVKVSF